MSSNFCPLFRRVTQARKRRSTAAPACTTAANRLTPSVRRRPSTAVGGGKGLAGKLIEMTGALRHAVREFEEAREYSIRRIPRAKP